MAKQNQSKNILEKKPSKHTTYERLDHWCEQHDFRWLMIVLAIGFIASILSFDIKPSVDGDDTSYVLSAMNIVHSGQLPVGFRTPGYPITLYLDVWCQSYHSQSNVAPFFHCTHSFSLLRF